LEDSKEGTSLRAFRSLAPIPPQSYGWLAPELEQFPFWILLQIGHGDSIVNLRQATRYLLSCPAQYWWVSADGLPQNSTGITRDLATSGVFVRSEQCPPIGAQVELSIALPNCEDTGFGMRLRGVGKVLRVEQEKEICTGGFAVLVHLDASSP
jgi:hypothetical protein